MKISTINFWCGAIIGFGVAKYGRKWYTDIKNGVKKILGIVSPSKNGIDTLKEHLNEINNTDARRTTNSSGSDSDRESLSELLNTEKYKTDDETSDNVVMFDKNIKYININEIPPKIEKDIDKTINNLNDE